MVCSDYGQSQQIKQQNDVMLYLYLTLNTFSRLIFYLFTKTLHTLELERKIYKNEMIAAKDKGVIHASRSRTSRLQVRLRETSNL